MIALDDTLKEWEAIDPQQSRAIELRFFGCLFIEETTAALTLSPATVKREWATAKLWLHRQISQGKRNKTGTSATT